MVRVSTPPKLARAGVFFVSRLFFISTAELRTSCVGGLAGLGHRGYDPEYCRRLPIFSLPCSRFLALIQA